MKRKKVTALGSHFFYVFIEIEAYPDPMSKVIHLTQVLRLPLNC